jgi:hypothetical protein
MIGGLRHVHVVVAALVLMSVGCTTGADEVSSASAADVATSAGPSGGPSAGPSADELVIQDDTQPTDGAMERSTASAAPRPPLPDSDLRGDNVAWFAPRTPLTVFGLGATLNVRKQPGVVAPIVGNLRPADDIVATGRARRIFDEVWVEVRLSGRKTTGWADRRFLGVVGRTESIGSELPATEQPWVGPDALDLGLQVLDALGLRQLGDPVIAETPVVRRTVAIAFDLREASESRLGYRIRVVARPVEATERQVELARVERTYICARAVTRDGRCR